MLEPKTITIKSQDGATEKSYVIHKFPAVAGREIIAKYPTSNAPKLGDYTMSEETMLKLMGYVGVDTAGGVLLLTTKALVDNHVPDWYVLAQLEFRTLEYNCAFFMKGLNSGFLESFGPKLRAWISPMLTDLLGQLSGTEKPPSMN